MKNRHNSQDVTLVSFRNRSKKRNLPKILGCLGGLGLCALILVVTVLGGYYFTRSRKAVARPLVSINSPLHREQLETGQTVTVQAVARDDTRIVRIELWVDGQLQVVETSNLDGGISPFPLLTGWLPTEIGTHTLTVRSFNTHDGRGQASIDVEVVEGRDRDGDEVLNEVDACPDQPGPVASGGCPTSNDMDADGIPDPEDTCPDELGVPDLSGCPDRDGDRTSDHLDLCPDLPGLPESGGCPDTGARDSDGDLIPDDVDLADDEPGLPEHGGAPVPGEGEDADEDGIPDDEEPSSDPFDDLLPEPGSDLDEILIPVEIEALRFSVEEDYDTVWCYAGLAGGDMERYGLFDPSRVPTHDDRYWDIYAVLGGWNSVQLMVPDEPLALDVECWSEIIFLEEGWAHGTVFDLGSESREHPRSEWDGTTHSLRAQGPDERGFRLEYRICEGACRGMVLPPPVIGTRTNVFGNDLLEWNWFGERENLAGYYLFFNGAHWYTLGAERTSLDSGIDPILALMLHPPCELTYELYMTAFDELGRESPHSNMISITGDPCPRRARVTFLSIETNHLYDSRGRDEWICGRDNVAEGPIVGEFRVDGADYGTIAFDTLLASPDEHYGVCLETDSTYTMMELFDECQQYHGLAFRPGFETYFEHIPACPGVDFVEVNLSSHDDLTISVVFDQWYVPSSGIKRTKIIHDEHTFREHEIESPTEYSFFRERDGYWWDNKLTVRVELLPREP